ncbi:MAG TPA: hypothetical protein VE732_06540 [Nitrososphaera sp.]|jgi:hypothetical protein|nr:hypothetical protein [Nitrososphaera sp.]
MNYKEGDRVVGEIYKGDERITRVKFGGVTRNETGGLQFDVAVGGWTSKVKIGDDCRLVTEDGETKVRLASMSTIGEAPNQATFMMFSIMQD